MHKAAAVAELEQSSGGIRQSLHDAVTLEMKAAIGCCKCVFFCANMK